jgi:hypothetical protein
MAYLESGGSYNPQLILLLDFAFENAWAKVQSSPHATRITRQMLAKELLALARDGERDPVFMAEQAVAKLQHAPSSREP